MKKIQTVVAARPRAASRQLKRRKEEIERREADKQQRQEKGR
jgi:hypothetical protein